MGTPLLSLGLVLAGLLWSTSCPLGIPFAVAGVSFGERALLQAVDTPGAGSTAPLPEVVPRFHRPDPGTKPSDAPSGPALRDWTEDHGDPNISDDHTSFKDRGVRPYQDIVDVDFAARSFETGVNVVYGNLIHRRSDIEIPGRGLPLRLAFTYNSGSFFDGRYGYGWQMNYNVRYVTNSADQSILIVRPDDRTDIFLHQPDGTFLGSYGVRDSLIALAQGFKLIVWNDLENGTGDYLVYSFDSPDHHYATRLADRSGNQLLFTYNPDKQLTSVTDACGRSLLFHYVDNKLIFVTDPAGRQFLYAYNGNGDLVSVTYPTGATTTYTYEPTCHDCVSVTDANGHCHHFTYDPDFAVATVIGPLGTTSFSFSYDWALGVTSVTNGNGQTFEYAYDGQDRVVSIVDPLGDATLRGYDAGHNLVSHTDPNGNVTTRAYDFRGNLIRTTDALHGISTTTWEYVFNRLLSRTDANGNTWTHSYDDAGNLLTVTDPLGQATSFIYDAFGQPISKTDARGGVTVYQYNACGDRTSVMDALTNQTTYSYDDRGNLLSETDPLGATTSYTYDALNRLLTERDALGRTMTHTYDAVGNETAVTDRTGNTTQYTYDGLNRLIRITDALGNFRTHTYDGVGNMSTATDENHSTTSYAYDAANRLTVAACPIGCLTTYSYDPAGNVVARTDGSGNTISYQYDPLNRMVTLTDGSGGSTYYSYDPVGNQLAVTDANGNTISYSYDRLDRVIAAMDGAGGTTVYSYDAVGNRIATIGANGNGAYYGYDACNRPISMTSDLGHVTRYGYDAAGRRTWASDANGNTWSLSYDPLGQVVNILSPLGNSTRYSYDGVGNVIRRIAPNLAATDYQYDALGRRLSAMYPAGRTEMQYDAAGNLLRLRNIGIGLNDQTFRTYDAANRLVAETIDYGPFVKSVSYAYDGAGNLASLTDPDGLMIMYAYDAADHLVTITDQSGEITTLSYDPAGRKTESAYPTGDWTLYTYDTADRLATQTTRDSSSAVIVEYGYTHDAAGLVLQAVTNGILEAGYQYNQANWLQSASYVTGQNYQYTYDAVGNRLAQQDGGNVTSYAYNAENRVLTQVLPGGNTINYAYDSNANVIQTASSWGIVGYQYDFENRLVGITYPPPFGSIANFYSPEGVPLAREERGQRRYYFPTLQGTVVEMDALGNTTTRLNPGLSLEHQRQKVQIHGNGQGSTTYFTGSGVVATFTFGYFREMLAYSGDVDGVDPGLYAACMKVDWDPLLGAELIGGDYAPDVDQRFGGTLQDLVRLTPEAYTRYETSAVLSTIGPAIALFPRFCRGLLFKPNQPLPPGAKPSSPMPVPTPTPIPSPGPSPLPPWPSPPEPPPKPDPSDKCRGICVGGATSHEVEEGPCTKAGKAEATYWARADAKTNADQVCQERAGDPDCLCQNGKFVFQHRISVEFPGAGRGGGTQCHHFAISVYRGTCRMEQ